jgi:hypothetical protein
LKFKPENLKALLEDPILQSQTKGVWKQWITHPNVDLQCRPKQVQQNRIILLRSKIIRSDLFEINL